MTTKRIGEHLEVLPCHLTSQEFEDRATQLANVAVRASELESAMEEKKAEWKRTEKQIDGDHRRLSRIIRERQEPRDVKCEVWGDYDRRVKRTVRCDTGEVIKEEAMTPSELQLHFDIPMKPKPVLSAIPPPDKQN